MWCSCFDPAQDPQGGTETIGGTTEGDASTTTSQGTSGPTGTSTSSSTSTATTDGDDDGLGSTSEDAASSGSTSEGTDDGAEASSSESGDPLPPPGCGNGIVDPDEECDDGNDDDTDACTYLCREAACGDGFIQPSRGEICEPGEVPEGSCWAQGEEWGGTLACASTCDAITTETCLEWEPTEPRLAHGIELGVTGVEFDAAGNAHVLYASRDAANNLQLYTVRYDAETAGWGTPIPLVQLSAMVAEPFFVQNSALTVAPSGVAFVAYAVAQGGVSPYDVYVTRFDPETALWGTRTRIDSGNYVAIHAGASEEAVLLWQDPDYQATFSRYAPQTDAWSSPARLSASLDSLNTNGIFVRDDGRAFSMTGSGGRLYVSTLDAEWTHTPLTAESDAFSPSRIAGAARHGSALVGCSRLDGTNDEPEIDVYVLDEAVSVVGERTRIPNASSLTLGMGEAGHGAIAYWENLETWYLRSLQPGDGTFGDPVELSSFSGVDHIAIDPEGNIIVFGNSVTFGTFHAERFDAGAQAWSAAFEVFIPGDGLYAGSLRTDINEAGHVVLAATDGPGGRGADNNLNVRHLR